MTSVHHPEDTRIYHKMCKSLHKKGYDVTLITTSDTSFKDKYGINIIGIGTYTGKWQRIIIAPIRIFGKIIRLKNIALFHFHDPELIPLCLLLKLFGRRVIFDVHENITEQILYKDYLTELQKRILVKIVAFFEWISGKTFNAIITVTENIKEKYPEHKTYLIQNFAILDGYKPVVNIPYSERPNHIIYIGNIVRERGLGEVIKALELIPDSFNIRLIIAGMFGDLKLLDEFKKIPGWRKTEYLGWKNRDEVAELLAGVRVGLIVSHQTTEYYDSLPNKLLEYMSVALPVIASDYPQMNTIVQNYKCGVLITPFDIADMANKILYLIENQDKARDMGERGMEAVNQNFSWLSQEEKLFSVYEKMLKA